jgi:hypothetical protein
VVCDLGSVVFTSTTLLRSAVSDRRTWRRCGAVAQLGERLNGIQEVDGSTPFSSTLCLLEGSMGMRALRVMVVCVMLCGSAPLVTGCAARQEEWHTTEEPASIERPASPLEEEKSLADRAGEVMVVILVVGITVGLILVPILFL